MKFSKVFNPNAVPMQETNSSSNGLGGKIKSEDRIVNIIETGRNRLLVAGLLFALSFSAIAIRVVELSITNPPRDNAERSYSIPTKSPTIRADIVDRNGILLATSLPTTELYANPRRIQNIDKAARKLNTVLPELQIDELKRKLSANTTFVWLHRKLTPKLLDAVNALGIGGLEYQSSEQRVYPHGRLFSHILGMTNIDGEGIGGIEREFDKKLKNEKDTLQLSVDARVQAAVRRELATAMRKFSAIGSAGVVLDVETGEVISMVSLPDYDPNYRIAFTQKINRVTKGVYEMGSTLKLFTAATIIELGQGKLKERYDATKPLKLSSRYTIKDYHPQNSWLSIPEIIVHSSNIGAARIAQEVGSKKQREFLRRFGFLSPLSIELPELGIPLTPQRWGKIENVTISYGYGISMTPLHLCQGISALVNGGFLTEATLIKKRGRRGNVNKRVISDKTSSILKDIMRSVVRFGTGKKADVEGYLVGGKTGTAEKPDIVKRGYNSGKLLSSFVGVFPSNQPKYIVFVMLDEPKGIKSTFGKATGGWVAAPTVGNIIRQIVIINGMAPNRISEKKLNPGDPMYIKSVKVRRNRQVINKTGASKFENKLKYFLRKETKLGGLKVEVN